MKRWFLALIFSLALTAPAVAVNPGEMLKDPAQEERARHLSKDLRCLVCQNQSIDDSDAELARDLRVILRERITAGDSDQQIVEYLTSRYGDYVLLKPPFKASTLVLWLGPALLLLIGVFVGRSYYRRQDREVPTTEAAPLSEEERRRLADILGKGETN